jgi:DeoR family transcriptional regulator of aga operon
MSGREVRLARIVDALDRRGALSVDDLGDLLSASPATVRRDLTELTRQRRIVRTRGGARVFRADEEAPIPVRDTLAPHAKAAIGRAVASLLPRRRIAVALGGGTTTSAVLEAIRDRHDITVVTNSLTVAARASRIPFENIVVIGGYVRHESQELVGSFAEHTFGAVHVAYAILGAGGVTVEGGVTTHDEAEARTNHAMIASAQRTIVVADGSKFGHLALAPLARIDEISTIVTDPSAPIHHVGALRQCGVEVVVAHL